MASELTRPIIGIENRTAQEVFDIMCDRFRGDEALSRTGAVKALEWLPYPNPALAGPDVSVAPVKTWEMQYQVHRDPWALGFMAYLAPEFGSMFWESKGHIDLDTAKAAAQADFERRILSALTTEPAAPETRACTCHPNDNPPDPCAQKFAYSDCVAAAPEGRQDDGHTDADGYPYEFTRPSEQAVTEAWREITEDDQPPLDTDVIMGHWLTVSTRPTEWLVEVGHYGSKRGGWIHGGATHWLPLDVLPAAPALAQEGK